MGHKECFSSRFTAKDVYFLHKPVIGLRR